LLARARDARGLAAGDIASRVGAALDKYLFRDQPDASGREISQFVEELRSDDLCLIVACERGDETAWEDLVANFDSTVKSAARKITSNTEDAEDLASSIWAELYGLRTDVDGNKKSKLAYYSGRGSLAGWLRAVVSQLAVDQFRKTSKFVQIEEDREFENLANEAATAGNGNRPWHRESPEALLDEAQTATDVSVALTAAIAALEAEDRLILKLYYFENQKLKTIAETFGYHEATASRKLARVQNDIRKGVERELKTRHGWTEPEVKRYLSETAASLGMNLESLFAVLLLVAAMQDFLS